MANNKDFIVKNAVEIGGPTNVTLGTITGNAINLSTGNYFKDTLAANTTYSISNAGDVQSFQLEVTGGIGSGYNLSTASYTSKSYNPTGDYFGVRLNNDGTRLYQLRNSNDTIYQYNLSTAFDVSTASASGSIAVGTPDTEPSGFTFNNDGSKLYTTGLINDSVFQWSLSTAFDITTASYDSVSFSVSSQETSPYGVSFNPSGTSMYVIGVGTDSVYQYTLSTAFDLSTASYASKSFSFSSQDSTTTGFAFNGDGTKAFMVGDTNNTVFQYSLSTAYDVSTLSYDSVSFDASSQLANPYSITFSSNGSVMYVSGSTPDGVYQYNTGVDATITYPSSIEFAGGVAPAAPATGETDIFTFSTDDGGTSYIGTKTADNLS